MHLVTVTDHVSAPLAPSADRLRDGLFKGSVRRLAGLVRFDGEALRVGPFVLLSFGEPVLEQTSWRRPITGGLLAASAGGTVAVNWRDGVLSGRVEGYHPRLPRPLYRLSQLPFHHVITRMALLDMRGRIPSPGIPAEPTRRLAAAAIDVGICVALVGAMRPRHKLAALGATLAAYHVGFWTWNGRTPGARLAGVRMVAVDGSRVTRGQALLRLLALPLGVRELRARHDDLAGTEIVREQRP